MNLQNRLSVEDIEEQDIAGPTFAELVVKPRALGPNIAMVLVVLFIEATIPNKWDKWAVPDTKEQEAYNWVADSSKAVKLKIVVTQTSVAYTEAKLHMEVESSSMTKTRELLIYQLPRPAYLHKDCTCCEKGQECFFGPRQLKRCIRS
jgi:hypothetical protein